MEITNFKELEDLIKNDPEKATVILRYPSNQMNFEIISITNTVETNIIHLFSRYQPSYLYSIFISNSFQPDFESNYLFFRKNVFKMTWLHILCMYNIEYFDSIKDFVTYSIAKEQDTVGNTFLHIVSRFNPKHLKKIINIVFDNMDFRFIFLKKDILGNTFLHILCIYHPNLYNEYKDIFGEKMILMKNKFGKICTDYL